MNLEKYFSQNEDDESFSFSLSEKDWRSYLAAIDAEAGHFFRAFVESRCIANHLDMLFIAMKWKKIVFSGSLSSECDDEIEVVTFHKNPMNIAAKAVFFFMEKICDFLMENGKHFDVPTCWKFAKQLSAMKTEMLSGFASVEACEYLLGICHFKNVIAAVNGAIVCSWDISDVKNSCAGAIRDLTIALFDIREIAWQSIVLCNVAENRYTGDFSGD
jgi:hypothetical protein